MRLESRHRKELDAMETKCTKSLADLHACYREELEIVRAKKTKAQHKDSLEVQHQRELESQRMERIVVEQKEALRAWQSKLADTREQHKQELGALREELLVARGQAESEAAGRRELEMAHEKEMEALEAKLTQQLERQREGLDKEFQYRADTMRKSLQEANEVTSMYFYTKE